MSKIRKIHVATGIYWVEIPEAEVFILCGCPADSVKHLMKKGFIAEKEEQGVTFETGPNVILLSDIQIQNGSFSNLAEFPVLQMFYRQGMLLPDNPVNYGNKPILVGSDDQVKAQLQYIYRGNYGLVSKEELEAAGLSTETADELMRVKVEFAFGQIKPFNELLDSVIISGDSTEIKNGVMVRRLNVNKFEISFMDEAVTVDLNLSAEQNYEVPYPLGFHNIKREYFTVVHAGEGDGWDINRPCMSSILFFQGKIYLIDAGPNIIHSLKSLGISINEIEGIFHTHNHDDHFAGLMTLMRADHKIKYFATQHVRTSVIKKLSAVASMEDDQFTNYFDVHDLWIGVWNEIDALEVKPIISPHPVETTIFYFRVMGDKGYSTYGHLADIASKSVLKKMINEGDPTKGITRQYYDSLWNEYLIEADVKKLDIGGGLIHGDALDFVDDRSKKIILSHTSQEINNEQKKIGSGAPFGMTDHIIMTHQDFIRRDAFGLLSSYFPTIPKYRLNALLNNPLVTFNPETLIMKKGEDIEYIYLILTGNVEIIKDDDINTILSSGSIAGEYPGLTNTPLNESYRTMNFVNALKISASLYSEFVMLNEVFDRITLRIEMQDFLQHIWLFNESLSYPVLSDIIENVETLSFPAGMRIIKSKSQGLYIIKEGSCRLILNNETIETLGKGDFFGEGVVLYDTSDMYQIEPVEDTQVFFINSESIKNIPIVHWKLFEVYRKRLRAMLDNNGSGPSTFSWREEYSVNLHNIDSDHKTMFEAAETLSRSIEQGQDTLVLKDVFNFLINYTTEHFKREEQLMSLYSYPDLEMHSRKHLLLTEEVVKFKQSFEANESTLDTTFLSFLQNWILEHILTEDRKYATYLNERNVH
jgi:hemerythrin